jgi:MFS family permease
MIAPFVGYFIDRFGPRYVMLWGILLTGLGFVFLSRVNSLWQFYAAFTLITLGLSFGSFMVVTTSVANWFVAKRGRALAMMSAGSALGGLLLPLIVWLIAATDWRTSLLMVGVGFWIVGIPVAMVMRSRPEDYGYLPDGEQPRRTVPSGGSGAGPSDKAGDVEAQPENRPRDSEGEEASFTLREAMRTRTFWQLAVAMGAGSLIMSASVHQIPALTSFGVSRGTAGVVIMGVSLIGLIGRLGGGFLGDVVDKRRVIAAALLFQFIGTVVFVFIEDRAYLLPVFVVFWGIGFGGSIPVRFALLADYFGRRHFGSIMGVLMTVTTLFSVGGPVFVGWMFDIRANYQEPYLILSGTLLVSIPLMLTVARPVLRPAVQPD